MGGYIPAGFADVRAVWTGGPSDPVMVTFAAQIQPDNFTPTTIGDVGAFFRSIWNDGVISDSWVLDSLVYTFGPTEEAITVELGVGENGGVPDAITSPNVAYLMRKSTATGGRKGRGRTFWPCVTEESIDGDGLVDSSDLTTLQGFADDWYEGFASAGGVAFDAGLGPLVVLHEDPDDEPSLVTDLRFDAYVATQRRRLRG